MNPSWWCCLLALLFSYTVISRPAWFSCLHSVQNVHSSKCVLTVSIELYKIYVYSVYFLILTHFYHSDSSDVLDLPDSSWWCTSAWISLHLWLTFGCCGWSHIHTLKICSPQKLFMPKCHPMSCCWVVHISGLVFIVFSKHHWNTLIIGLFYFPTPVWRWFLIPLYAVTQKRMGSVLSLVQWLSVSHLAWSLGIY